METEVISVFSNFWHAFLNRLPGMLLALAALIIFIFIGNKAGKVTAKRLETRSHDKLIASFTGRIVKYVFITVGFLVAMNVLGFTILAGGIITGAGISAAIFGFAFKNIGENILAGFLLAFNRPFKVGDLIEINGMQGNITSVDFRSTNIKTADGVDIFIPNSLIITNPLSNFTFDNKRRFNFLIMIDYSYDVDKIRKIVLDSVSKTSEVLKDPPPLVIVDQLSSNVNIKVFYWIDTYESNRSILIIKSELIENSKNDLQNSGYSIADISQISLTNEIFNVKVNS